MGATALGREAIYSALFAQLQAKLDASNGGPFKFMSRRYSPPGSLPSSQYPALFLVEQGEMYERNRLFLPVRVTLLAHAVIQSLIGADPNSTPATEINNLADALETAVTTPDNLNGARTTTLSQLVQAAYINGRENQLIASASQMYSEQDAEIEMIISHPL
jgi:hypothetical protein